jgi:hypothetical protein
LHRDTSTSSKELSRCSQQKQEICRKRFRHTTLLAVSVGFHFYYCFFRHPCDQIQKILCVCVCVCVCVRVCTHVYVFSLFRVCTFTHSLESERPSHRCLMKSNSSKHSCCCAPGPGKSKKKQGEHEQVTVLLATKRSYLKTRKALYNSSETYSAKVMARHG